MKDPPEDLKGLCASKNKPKSIWVRPSQTVVLDRCWYVSTIFCSSHLTKNVKEGVCQPMQFGNC